MSDINQHISIPKKVEKQNDLDYSFLRLKGIEYIEQLGSKLWTDYNTHDPGITILEMLCYAITDLGLRIELPVENILSPEDNSSGTLEEQFFKASRILPSKPLNHYDYRKLFIDIEGVKNCWLKKYEKKVYVDCKNDMLSYNQEVFNSIPNDLEKEFLLQGLYTVLVDFDSLNPEKYKTIDQIKTKHNEVKEAIKTKYHKNRNLCEDLVEVAEVQKHPIAICTYIDILPGADEELVHAKVLIAIEKYFSPSVRFYSLQQMFDKGYRSDEIFEGPVLDNGFIDSDELKNADLRTEVRLSDIMNIIMGINGVNFIKEITIIDCNNQTDEEKTWNICVEEGKKPVLCHMSTFSYFKGVLPVNINNKKLNQYKTELESEETTEQEDAKYNKEIIIPSGTYLNTDRYTTIQNDFPDTYGISQAGLPSISTTERKSQAKQLKAYLLFFDQILASYFSHLGKVKDLLTVNNKLRKSYFTQAVSGIKDFEELITDYNNTDADELTDSLFSKLDKRIDRKNMLLDHLIARFAEKFSDYAFLMKEIYGSHADEAIIIAKEKFLKEYGEIVDKNGEVINKGISNWRGSSFNYYEQPLENLWNTTNVTGVQRRIASLAGIQNYNRRDLSVSFTEIYSQLIASKKVFRWRIRDASNHVILSSTKDYNTSDLASAGVYLAVLKILESNQPDIESAFKETIIEKCTIENFEIFISGSEKFYFKIIDTEIEDESAPERILARQNIYYDTQKKLLEAILQLITFLVKELPKEEGFYIIEHILLRPDVTKNATPTDYHFMPICTDKCESCDPVDPYSFRVTIVFPGWTYRFSNPDFRIFMEELIRKELPAHILPRICWIGQRKNEVPDGENQMIIFENAYREYLLLKTNSGQEQDIPKLLKLIEIMSNLFTIYPSGRLIDCDDEEETVEGKIILGKTNI